MSSDGLISIYSWQNIISPLMEQERVLKEFPELVERIFEWCKWLVRKIIWNKN